MPTMIVVFTRYSRDQSFAVIRSDRMFLLIMAAGSILGAFIAGRLLGIVPSAMLLLGLALILVISEIKISRHS